MYEVVDAYSEVLLGYYISDNEDYIAQYHAFRMAIQTSRYKPYETCATTRAVIRRTRRWVFLEDQPYPPPDSSV